MSYTSRLLAVLGLFEAGTVTMGDICRATGISPQGARFMVKRLESSGLIRLNRDTPRRGAVRNVARKEWVRA